MIAPLERVITLVNVNGYHVGDFFGVLQQDATSIMKQCICSEFLIIR